MRIISVVMAAVLALLLVGCASTKGNDQVIMGNKQPGSQTQSGPSAKKNVALVMKTLTNPFFVEMEKGARKAEKELGINLIVKTGAQETSIDQQIAIIEDLIQAKADAIVIAPASSTELIPVLKRAQDAKIPIINIDNQLDKDVCRKMGLADVPFISVNNEQGAYLSAKYISDKIGEPTDVVVLEGITSAINSTDRKNGALRAFKENPNINVVAVETANWKIDEAYSLTSSLFKSHPNIGAIFCANDMMGLGAVKYLGESGRTGVRVAAFDALNEAKQAIREGKMAVTIDQQADVQGYMGIKYAVQAISGDKIPLETFVEVKVVDRGSLQ
ncbi:MAG: sugar ABC transporter substrate-binding protein [Negativicutes bacterium]|nr:sugar ABC transporter substrate-binding protein [Negativicutes bacterium]